MMPPAALTAWLPVLSALGVLLLIAMNIGRWRQKREAHEGDLLNRLKRAHAAHANDLKRLEARLTGEHDARREADREAGVAIARLNVAIAEHAKDIEHLEQHVRDLEAREEAGTP